MVFGFSSSFYQLQLYHSSHHFFSEYNLKDKSYCSSQHYFSICVKVTKLPPFLIETPSPYCTKSTQLFPLSTVFSSQEKYTLIQIKESGRHGRFVCFLNTCCFNKTSLRVLAFQLAHVYMPPKNRPPCPPKLEPDLQRMLQPHIRQDYSSHWFEKQNAQH